MGQPEMVELADVYVFKVSSLEEFRARCAAAHRVEPVVVEDEPEVEDKVLVLGSIRDVVGAAHAPTMSEVFAA